MLNGQVQDAVAEALPAAEVVERPAYRTPAIGVDDARRIVAIGRVAAIWLPVFAVASHRLPLLDSISASVVFAAAWFVAIRHALGDARVTIWSLGAPLAAAVGTAGGLVLALALNHTVPGLGFPSSSLLKMALG